MSLPTSCIWKAALVDGFTQSSKTWKCLELLTSKIAQENGVLIIFVTQANCTASVSQTIQRCKTHSLLTSRVPSTNVMRSSEDTSNWDISKHNYMIVDFWHKRNKDNVIRIVKKQATALKQVILVIDEIEQGAKKGVFTRLEFIQEIESTLLRKNALRLIFITATVANLSKCIAKIAALNPEKFQEGIVQDVINEQIMEHHFVIPHDTYIGPSWFQTAKDSKGHSVWRPLLIPPKSSLHERESIIYNSLKNLPECAKELCLVVTSTKVEMHRKMSESLFKAGFNVIVQLNSDNDRNYIVSYIPEQDPQAVPQCWQIPYHYLASMANKGCLASTYIDDSEFETNINHQDNMTLAHILQASLFVRTQQAHARMKKNVSLQEFTKLLAIFGAISHMEPAKRRPRDYPQHPKVALVAGHLAGRGITIQNPFIDFLCTSFCFTDVYDVSQRGANNSQRFGRACGMLKEIYLLDSHRIPILLATKDMMRDAIANEKALAEKAQETPNGSLVSLRNFISDNEWQTILKNTKVSLAKKKESKSTKLTNTQLLLLAYYELSHKGTLSFTQESIHNHKQAKSILDKNNRRPHKELLDKKYITKDISTNTFTLTQEGMDHVIDAYR